MGDHEAEVDALVDEHRGLISITAALQRAMSDPQSHVEALLDQLETALGHHTEREECGLFHVLRQIEIPEQYVGLFEHDHGHIVDLLHAARRDRHGVDELLRTLDAHIVREENDMFPAAEQLLSPADWDAVEAAVADLGS